MSNESSADYHFVNEQLKEARRKITELEQRLELAIKTIEHQRDKSDKANELLDECEWLIEQALKHGVNEEEFNTTHAKLRDRKNG